MLSFLEFPVWTVAVGVREGGQHHGGDIGDGFLAGVDEIIWNGRVDLLGDLEG